MTGPHFDNTHTESDAHLTSTELMARPETGLAVPVPQQLLVLGVIMLLIFSGSIGALLLQGQSPTADEPTVAGNSTPPPATPLAPADIQPFSDVPVTGTAAMVWDVTNQRLLFDKNIDEQLPLASLTKLMTGLVAYELLEQSDTVAISQTALAQHGNSGLLASERFSRTSLLDLVLMTSSNDGAFALAQAAGATLDPADSTNVFVKAMNVRAEELGLTSTEFYNPTGLDINQTQGGGYGSARDVTFLMQHILTEYPDLLTATANDITSIYSHDGFRHDAANTNQFIDDIPGLIGSKTGYTDLAGGNLVIAFDAGLGRPVIVTVLGSTFSDRFSDVERLVAATLASVPTTD